MATILCFIDETALHAAQGGGAGIYVTQVANTQCFIHETVLHAAQGDRRNLRDIGGEVANTFRFINETALHAAHGGRRILRDTRCEHSVFY